MEEKSAKKQLDTLLIFGLAPSFLEKPAFWFARNAKQVMRARKINSWYERNTAVAEIGMRIQISEFLRKLSDLGYEKVAGELFKGTFKHLGSTIIIFPFYAKTPVSIDWSANIIDSIEEKKSDSIEQNWSEAIKKTKEVDFKSGDYVVHQDHGIGIFREMVQKSSNTEPFIKIEYAPAKNGGEPDTLLVPISQKKKVSQYIGFRTPQIHRLGTPLWQNVKRKTKENLIKFAKELLAIYKTRQDQKRTAYHEHPMEQKIWDDFPFEETAGQIKALNEIFKDMSRERPMERMLVGDVGFGKTEIALRAALRAVLNGKQTAILAPTTILCDQHFALFNKRLEDTPVSVARFSRLEKTKETKKILEHLKSGSLDILIATHRLISKNTEFKNLGLLIIDEEQRFGVRQKEAIKKQYPNVDILSLSATPIPRTMYMCLSTVREMSVLERAPEGKSAPKTFVLPFNKKLIREAIEKEIKSGGQVYYLSNRIRNIPKTLEFLNEILPKARKGIIHGRLSEKDIVKVMKDFREKRLDVLISTTIIENGLDISNVNTLIVEDASRLGLSQAHQIRGRVGRGKNAAFAYFFYGSRPTLKGRERLKILLKHQDLGAGIKIAREDLELRGAGNILGPEQSGAINRVGWNLYFQLLEESLQEIRQKENH